MQFFEEAVSVMMMTLHKFPKLDRCGTGQCRCPPWQRTVETSQEIVLFLFCPIASLFRPFGKRPPPDMAAQVQRDLICY